MGRGGRKFERKGRGRKRDHLTQPIILQMRWPKPLFQGIIDYNQILKSKAGLTERIQGRSLLNSLAGSTAWRRLFY